MDHNRNICENLQQKLLAAYEHRLHQDGYSILRHLFVNISHV